MVTLFLLIVIAYVSAYTLQTCPVGYTCTNPVGSDSCDATKTYTITKCPVNYYLDVIKNLCYMCTYACECPDRVSCTQCQLKYLSSCMTCKSADTACSCSNCLVCSGSECSSCATGYFLANSECTSCENDCKLCVSEKECSECFPGFYLTSSKSCSPCSSNCLKCMNESKCGLCADGYFVFNSSCIQCLPECATCINEYSCATCASGYYLNADTGSCDECTPPCLKCKSGTECILCDYYYYLENAVCKSCSTNCTLCTNSKLCQKCNCGSLLNKKTMACVTCPGLCNTCESSSNCLLCVEGYYSENGKCKKCGLKCKLCKSDASCYLCSNGYYSIDGMCSPCLQSNCDMCTASKCVQCTTGFYLINGTCYGCEPTCIDCSIYTVCKTCLMGYTLQNGMCVKCGYGCNLCMGEGSCQHCIYGFYIDSGMCKMCSLSGCAHCESATKCIKCNDGYYLYGSKCNECDFKCKKCVSSTYCMQCNSGYYKGVSECFECIYKCSSCSNTTYCSSCDDGYYYSGIICTACMDNCKRCDDSKICTLCNEGYMVSNSKCSIFLQGCTKFGLVPGSSTYNCTECNSTYYILLDSNKITICNKCGSNCNKCYNSSVCYTCSSGYYLQNEKCLACFNGCDQCSNDVSCSQCLGINSYELLYNPGYECKVCPNDCYSCNYDSCYYSCPSTAIVIDYYLGESCVAQCDIEGCKVCSSSKCKECLSGYHLSKTKTCDKCNEICKECNSDGACISCNRGYFLSLNGNCIKCADPNCKICSEKYACVECNSFYYLNANYSCDPCQYGCISCSSLKTCSKCADYLNSTAFYLDKTSCVQCPTGCYSCTNAVNCSHCSIGYYMSKTKECIACVKGCLHCLEALKCRVCKAGNFLENDFCSSCIENCKRCSNDSTCLECEAGYTLDHSLCVMSCIENCDKCSGKECISCISGFYLKNGTCKECPASQSECSYNELTKQLTGDCSEGYYFDSQTLECNAIAIANCSVLNSYLSCVKCIRGFKLTYDGTCAPSCVPNCQACSQPYTCFTCSDEYDSVDGLSCQLKCPANCKSCTSLKICKQCNDGYALSDSGECDSCKITSCLDSCKNVTAACYICNTYYFYYNISCYECNINQLSRAPMLLSYSLCTGDLKDVSSNSTIGKGYSGFSTYKNNICSIPFPKSGVLPYGKYNVTDILCTLNGNGAYRVLKLTAMTKFSTLSIYDSYFNPLYIYPESVVDTGVLNYTSGQNGIVIARETRDLITVGDIILVTTSNCTINLSTCEVIPPPIPGKMEVTVNSDNSMNFKATGWGFAEISDVVRYSISINLSASENLFVCDSTVSEFTCNQNNSMKLGYFSTAGTYKLFIRGCYFAEGKASISSDISIDAKFNSITTTLTAYETALKVKSYSEYSDFIPYFYQMRMAVNSLNGVLDAKSAVVQVNRSISCVASFCSYGGICRIIDGIRLCECNSNYAGFRCNLDMKTLNIIKESYTQSLADLATYNTTDSTAALQCMDILNSLVSIPGIINNSHVLNVSKVLLHTLSISHGEASFIKAKSIMGSIISSCFLEQYQHKYPNRRNLDSNTPSNNLISLNNILEIMSVGDQYAKSIAANQSLGQKEQIPINGIIAYLFRNTAQFNSINATIQPNASIAVGIELPYIMKGLISVPAMYEVDTAIIHIAAYTENSTTTNYTGFYNLSFRYNISGNSSKIYGYACACFDRNETDTKYCSTTVLNSTISCSCSKTGGACFVMKQVSPDPKIVIAIPAVGGAVIIAGIVLLIVYRKKICAKCRKKKEEETGKSKTYSPSHNKDYKTEESTPLPIATSSREIIEGSVKKLELIKEDTKQLEFQK